MSGLSKAPAVFQALVNDVPRNMPNHFLFVYLDGVFFLSMFNTSVLFSDVCSRASYWLTLRGVSSTHLSPSLVSLVGRLWPDPLKCVLEQGSPLHPHANSSSAFWALPASTTISNVNYRKVVAPPYLHSEAVSVIPVTSSSCR